VCTLRAILEKGHSKHVVGPGGGVAAALGFHACSVDAPVVTTQNGALWTAGNNGPCRQEVDGFE
jgi:hypothetical protein